jgi:hypothetical protein
MKTDVMSLAQVRAMGLEALSKALGPVGLVRFLQQFEAGSGDYTSERHQWLGEPTVRDLAQELAQRRTAHRDQVAEGDDEGTEP